MQSDFTLISHIQTEIISRIYEVQMNRSEVEKIVYNIFKTTCSLELLNSMYL